MKIGSMIVMVVIMVIAMISMTIHAATVDTYDIKNGILSPIVKGEFTDIRKLKCDQTRCVAIRRDVQNSKYYVFHTVSGKLFTTDNRESFAYELESVANVRADDPDQIVDLGIALNGGNDISLETSYKIYYSNQSTGSFEQVEKNTKEISGSGTRMVRHNEILKIAHDFSVYHGSNVTNHKALKVEVLNNEVYYYQSLDGKLRKFNFQNGDDTIVVSGEIETFYLDPQREYVYALMRVEPGKQELKKIKIDPEAVEKVYEISGLTKDYTVGDVQVVPGTEDSCLILRNGVMYCTENGGNTFNEWKVTKGQVIGGFNFVNKDRVVLHTFNSNEKDNCNFIKSERSCNAPIDSFFYCTPTSHSCQCEGMALRHFDQGSFYKRDNIENMFYTGQKCRIRATFPVFEQNEWKHFEMNFIKSEVKEGNFDCQSLFDTKSFGVNPICEYKADSKLLKVEFGSGTNMTANNNVKMDGVEFINTNDNSKNLESSPYYNIFKTEIKANYPTEIGKCDPITIDMSKSTKLTHRTTKYIYTTEDNLDQNLIGNVNDELLFIPPTHFDEVKTHKIQVRGVVFDFEESSRIVSENRTIEFTRTSVIMPRFDILGGSNQTTTLGKAFKLIAEPIVNFCSQSAGSTFTYTWSVPGNVAASSTEGKAIEVTFNEIGEFEISVTAHFGSQQITKFVTVKTQYPTIDMTFPTGNFKTASADKDLTLDVKVHNVLDPSNTKDFYWDCDNGFKANNKGMNSVVLPKSGLNAGNQVTCKVDYVYIENVLNTTGTITVDIVEGIVPQVQIIRQGNSDFAPAKQAFVVRSNVTGVSESFGKIVYKWTVKRAQNEITLVRGTNTLTPDNRATFALAPSMMEAGAEYEISLTVSGEKASIVGEGVNRILVKVNKPPSDGSCNVQPSTGTALTTEFGFGCASWIDEHQPLEYSFAIAPENSNDYQVLQRYSRKKEFISFIGLTGNLQVRTNIRDALGSEISVFSKITVADLSQAQIVTRLMELVNTNLKTALEIGDAEESRRLLSQISNTFSKLDAATVGDDYEKVKQTIITSLIQAKEKVLEEESESSVQQQSGIIKNLMENTKPEDVNSQEAVADFVNNLLDSPINVESSKDLGNSLSQVLGATSQLVNSDLQREAVTLKVLNSTIKMVDAMAKKQLNGALPTIVSTDNIQFGIFSSNGDDMSNGQIDLGNGATLSVPDNTVDTEEEVDISFTVLKNDPHFSLRSKDSAKNLTSSVSRLLFKIGGEEQLVHDRPKPIVFTIPAQNDISKIELDGSKAGIRPQCKYLNTLTNEWESTGCNMTSFTETTTTCECNHATDFGSFLDYVVPDVNILTVDDLKLLTELNTDNMTTLIVLCVMVGLYAISLAIFNGISLACCLGRRLSKRQQEEKKYIFSENQMRGYIRPLLEKMKKSHIWFSILFQPKTQDSFNASRRLTIVMVIIFGSLLSNALTFGTKQQNWVQSLLAGIFADIVTMPFIFGFTFLFIKVKPRGYKPPKKEKKQKKKNAMKFTKEEEYEYVMKQQQMKQQQMSSEETDSQASSEVIIASKSTNRMDIIYDKIDEKLKWSYDKYVYMTERVTWYGMAVLFLSTFFYFTAVAGCMAIIYHTIHWFSPELELFIFGTVAIFLYFAALEVIYLSTKARRFQNTNVSWRGNMGWKVQLIICLFLIVFSLCAQFALVFFMNALDRNGLPNEWVITLQVGLLACIGLVLIWIFDILRNPKKKEKVEKKEPGFMGRPWFPWYCAYPIYLACWAWMAGSGVALVIYGIKFNKWGEGTDIKWLTSSLVANVQNIFVSKPISFIAKTVVLMAIVRLLESLFFRIRRERKVESA
mmetsp:Transcript_11455/g.16932  ORF Transcript_11455/g.16932 Transcript_11455/m.16932 type:complete len:1825 (-) Transcript_11455:57-5531(-)